MVILQVPTLTDSLTDWAPLFGLWRYSGAGSEDITLDFSECRSLRQNAVAFLGAMICYVSGRGATVTIDWGSMPDGLRNSLARSGFGNAFGGPTSSDPGNAIPYRQDHYENKNELLNYLKEQWIRRDWISVSRRLSDAIVGTVWEIYANSFEHAGSSLGVFSCGEYLADQKELKLSVVDFGVGIPNNVRGFTGRSEMGAAETIRWAFIAGNTTKPMRMGRGVGLNLLNDFVKVNNGNLEVLSHNGYVVISGVGERYATLPVFFQGTVVNITLVCDENHYCFKSEVPLGPVF